MKREEPDKNHGNSVAGKEVLRVEHIGVMGRGKLEKDIEEPKPFEEEIKDEEGVAKVKEEDGVEDK